MWPRRHALALFFAVLIGIASGAPQFYVIHQMGSSFTGVFPELGNDDRYYQARSEEARDGYPYLGNPYIYELRDAESVSFWIPDAVLSYTGEFLGLDVQRTFGLFNFILPPVLFLLTYGLLLYATGKKLLSLVSALIFHAGLFMTAFIRSPSPQFNFLFVELSILAVIRLLRGERFSKTALGLSLGALMYAYPYFWTFVFGVVGAFFLATFMRRDLRRLSLPLFASIYLGALIGTPILIQTLGKHSEAYRETLLRLGQISTHLPAGLANTTLSLAFIIVGVAALWRWEKLRAHKEAWFFVSGTLGALLAANNQIFIGTNLEYSSHYFLPVCYFVFLGAVYVGQLVFDLEVNFSKKLAVERISIAVATIAIAAGAFHSIYPRIQVYPNHVALKRYGPILSWLKENTSNDSVVMAGEDLSSYIPAYTTDHIFYSRNANLHVMTDNEVWKRVILESWGSSFDDTFLMSHIGQIWGAHYYDQYGHDTQLNKLRSLFGLPQLHAQVLPQSAKEQFRNLAQELEKQPVETVLGDRRIDFAVEETEFSLPIWLKQVFPSMHEVYSVNGITIYALGIRTQKLSKNALSR